MAADYDGHVDPDGPAIERRDGPVMIRKFSVASMDNNVYLVVCAATRQALVVDAAARPDRIREELGDVDPVAVVQTHGHWDHVRAWDALTADPGLEVWGHHGDLDLYPASPDRLLEGGEHLTVGNLDVEVLHTPGHTPGSLMFLVRGEARAHLVTGDSLFPGGLGRTEDTARFHELFEQVTSKVFDRLPDATWVYPGHGDDTTLAAERPQLDAWFQRKW